MGFLSGLFKKKPGGTFFGNLIRGVTSSATGGMLGSGANRIELGQTKTNAQLAAESAAAGTTPNPYVQGTAPPPTVQSGTVQTSGAFDQLNQSMGGIVEKLKDLTTIRTEVKGDNSQIMMLGGVAIAIALIFSLNGNKGGRR